MESYTEFLLQSRDHESWISKMPNQLIKCVCNYLSIVPTTQKIMENLDRWIEEKEILLGRLSKCEKQIRDKLIKEYANEKLPEMAKRAGFQGQWIEYNPQIDGDKKCMVGSGCSMKPVVILVGTRFAQCMWHDIEEILPSIEKYYEDRKKPMSWYHVDAFYPSWCQ